MSTPSEHKTVQARIPKYAQEIGWTFVSREEAEQRRGGIPAPFGSESGGQECPPSVFFDDLLDANPASREATPGRAGSPSSIRAAEGMRILNLESTSGNA